MYTRFLAAELEQVNNLKVIQLESSAERKSQKILKAKVAGSQSLVHYPYFDLFFPTLPFFRGSKSVVTVHDVIPLKFPKQYPPGKKGKLTFFRQLLSLRKADAIITDSLSSKEDIVKHLHIRREKIHVVYLAANPELQQPEEKVLLTTMKKYQLPKEYVLYVGDINYNKNIPQLIKAMKYFPPHLHLVCVGRNFIPQDIPEWKAIETQLALSNVLDRVHFLTELSAAATNELAAVYAGAQVYVQPSLYEGFGLPILEAMQCRTPVVAVRSSSLVEVGGEVAEYVEDDAESLANGIKQVLSWSKTRREERVRAGYKWSKEFSWAKTALETVKVYHSLFPSK